MANTTGSHDGHALIDGLLRTHEHNWASHNLPNRSLFRRPPFEHDFAGIIPLRYDTHQFALSHANQSPYFFVSHLLDRFVERLVRGYGPNNVAAFPFQDSFNCLSQLHGSTCRVAILARMASYGLGAGAGVPGQVRREPKQVPQLARSPSLTMSAVSSSFDL